MKRLRIGMLLDRTFPPDPRVANEARSLVAAGHEVHVLCLRHDDRQPEEETWQGIHLRRLAIPRWFYRKASAVSLDFPAYRWYLRAPLARFLANRRIEALHTHDLPMVAEGLRAARRRRIPLVADLHENWPAALRTYGYAQRLPGRVLISPSRWERHERKILPRADRVIVVIEEARERLLRLGIDPERIVVVRNTVEVDEFRGFGLDEEIVGRFRGRFVLSYLGGFERHRGIETAIAAMPAILEKIPGTVLLLVGTGSTEPSLRAQAARLSLGDRVVFEGWRSFRSFPSYIAASSVCLIPHVKNDHTDTTIPHKLFHYMLLERPVLATDCRPIARILSETGCGVTVPSGDAEAMARAAISLADPSTRERMGAAGRRAVLDRYNWERDAATLRATYEGLASGVSTLGTSQAS
ncbi:MAG: glycosyltransferase family 4 protein [Candidatus Eisenbacteria bacterium]